MAETPEDVYREPVEDLYPEGRTACDSRDCQFVHDHSRPGAPENVYRAALDRLDETRRRLDAALIASAYLLETPFTNAPEASPWERSVKPAMYALRRAIAAVRADGDAAYAAGRRDGYGQGRDDEANGEDLPEWYRLATGEICRPGQPYSCGDFHHNGKCVREVRTDA